jgi:hypothetical protein
MYTTGFASNSADLINKIRIFLTTTLPISERWTQLRYINTSGLEELVLQGNGTGTDSIIIGFKHYYAALNFNSEIILQHFNSFNNALSFEEQDGAITVLNNYITFPCKTPSIFLANSTTYWFMGNSRRFMMVGKTDGYYFSMYLGFIYPYANPNDWANPVAIGGSGLADFSGVPLRLFETSYDGLTSFWNPRNGYFSTKFNNVSTLMIKDSNASQIRPYNNVENVVYSIAQGTFPYVEIGRSFYGQYNTLLRNSNNNYHLMPIQILANNSICGEFEGIRFVTGNGLNPEDTISVGGESWLCVPNINLLSPNQWAAFRMT